MTATMRTGWDWRKAASFGGVWLATDHGPRQRRFHAYDADDLAACEPSCGLVATCEEPTEGSDFCPACMDIVRRSPDGRRP